MSSLPLTDHQPVGTTWNVELFINEDAGVTRAVAYLHAGGRSSLAGTGIARLNPADRDVPRIGSELAAARALTELARRISEQATADLADVTRAWVTPDLR